MTLLQRPPEILIRLTQVLYIKCVQDCGELSRGLAAVLPLRQPSHLKAGSASGAPMGLAARVIVQSSDKYKHCARCPLDACRSLTFGNPANVARPTG